ncbi:activating signal cointegrator 1-like [Glandiceps talaboti]
MSSASQKLQWCSDELSRYLHVPSSEVQDIAKYVLNIDITEELEEYMLELLDGSNPKHRRFIDELKSLTTSPKRQPLIPDNVQVYRKFDDTEDQFQSGEKTKSKKTKQKPEKQKVDLMKIPFKPRMPGDPPVREEDYLGTSSTATQSAASKQGSAKKKQKYVSLYSTEGQAKSIVQIPGRHPCECQAQKHRLINNCVKCGRVVCEQEGSGPCFFCGALVCTPEEQEVLARNSHKSEKLLKKLMGDHLINDKLTGRIDTEASKMKANFEKAVKHKDKLIEYDRTSVRRTQVIDDESDYFATDTNRWLSKTERDALKKREDQLREVRHGSRRNKKVTLDFAGRQVLDDNEVVDMYNRNDAVVQAINFGTDYRTGGQTQINSESGLINPNITQKAPKFVLKGKSKIQNAKMSDTLENSKAKSAFRIQDRELLEMSDDGMSLSMHQPWASLLIAGIKIHEGRTWYSPHRGRLWIAAAAKKPTPQEITELENMHAMMNPDEDFEFPEQYPISCLLGCVDVVDCMSQEQYREKFPNGESASPYVFICENPQELVVKFPIKGQHKIWKLEPHIHQAAKKGLRRK